MARTQIDKSLIASVNSSSLVGTTTNDNAAAGIVGQYVESVQSLTNIPSTGLTGDLTSISLTAGDWDVSFQCLFSRTTATLPQFTDFEIGISTTPGNSSAGLVQGSNRNDHRNGTAGLDISPSVITNFRMSLASTTTVYAKISGTYTGGQPQAAGRLSARRVR